MGRWDRIQTLAFLVVCLFSGEIEGLLTLGDDAPPFLLCDQEGFKHSLIQHRGQFLLIFFYPRDFSHQSVKMAKAFEKLHPELSKQHVLVYGVSQDEQKMHARFHEKLDLSFDLLADPEGKAVLEYEAKGFLGIKTIAYLIGPDGRIFRKYAPLSPMTIPDLVLQDLALIEKVPLEEVSHIPLTEKALPKRRSLRSYLDQLVEPLQK